MKVLTYIRVSSKGQIEGDGPERQRLACDAFAKRHSLTLGAEFFDAYTGASEDRPAFAQMIDSLRANAGQVQAVVIERMDRLARDLMASEFLLRELRELGVKLFVADQGNLDDMASNDVDPTRILIRQILGALAQWEKTCLVKKLRAAQLRAKAEGRPSGQKPYGVLSGENDGLRQLAEWNRQGYTHEEIADMMNARGYPSRTGKPWSRHTIRGIVNRFEKPSAEAERKELANLL